MNDVLNKIGVLVRDPGVQVDFTGFVFALGISTLVGLVVSFLYQIFYENRATGSQINRSFLLISPSITGLFIAIQFSLPLSLGLLGALSIIRFRTPIKEPEEVGFIMLLISCAVVCATFQFMLLLVLLSLAVCVLTLQKYLPQLVKSRRKDGILLISLNNDTTTEVFNKISERLEAQLANVSVQNVSFVEDIKTIQYSFNSLKSSNLNDLSTSLNEIAPIQKLNIYFNSQGSIF